MFCFILPYLSSVRQCLQQPFRRPQCLGLFGLPREVRSRAHPSLFQSLALGLLPSVRFHDSVFGNGEFSFITKMILTVRFKMGSFGKPKTNQPTNLTNKQKNPNTACSLKERAQSSCLGFTD